MKKHYLMHSHEIHNHDRERVVHTGKKESHEMIINPNYGNEDLFHLE